MSGCQGSKWENRYQVGHMGWGNAKRSEKDVMQCIVFYAPCFCFLCLFKIVKHTDLAKLAKTVIKCVASIRNQKTGKKKKKLWDPFVSQLPHQAGCLQSLMYVSIPFSFVILFLFIHSKIIYSGLTGIETYINLLIQVPDDREFAKQHP